MTVTDSVAWDRFWEAAIARYASPLELTHLLEISKAMIPIAHRRGLETALSVGCGISLDVRALAAAGLSVDGLDASTVAISYARTFAGFEAHAEHLLGAGDRREGGAARFHVGDVLDPAACPGPYDLIVSRGTMQYFHTVGRLDEGMSALVARLSPQGCLALHTHGAIPAMDPITEWLRAHRFRVSFRAEDPEFMQARAGERAAWHAMSTG